MLLTVDGNEKLVKKTKFWKGVGYVTLGAFIGTGIGYYFSERGSDAELYTGVACFCSLLSIPIVNNFSVSYKLQAIDNYNLSPVQKQSKSTKKEGKNILKPSFFLFTKHSSSIQSVAFAVFYDGNVRVSVFIQPQNASFQIQKEDDPIVLKK